ncbi:TonB-dependent receptor [Piscinibacter terrae]|nr:TonB-dependent receptor [Albitalea terrae]
MKSKYSAASGRATGRVVRLSLMSSAVLAALASMSAQAQDAAPAPAAAASAPAPKAPVEKLEAVIVTGTARSEGLKKLDASFSITTAGEEQIKDAAPASAADLLKIVPGVSVETTGGQTGNNIEVRGFAATGDAPWTSFQLNGATIYAVPTLSFFEGSSLFRLDDTIERVEVLRGGPSPIFADGNPGATVNFIMKKGGNVPEGGLRVTTGTGDLRRVDTYYAGKISDGWYGSFGGFYRTTQGVRDTQFPSDRGGQFSAMLTRKLEDNGELSIYGRVLNDKNTFFLPIPLLTSNGGHTLDSYPGFPAQTATFIGNELRQVAFESTPGTPPGKTKIDMADGRGVQMQLYGVNLDKKLGDWTIANKSNTMSGTVPTYAWFTGANPSTLDEFIAANLNGSTGGSGTYVNNGGGAVAGTTQVLPVSAWAVVKKLQSFTNDFRISRDLNERNTLTLGAYFSDYSSQDDWSLGNTFLTTLQQNGRLVDVTLTGNPAGDKVLTKNGQLSGAFFNLNANYNGQNMALFAADEWKASEKLRVDGGVRYERQRINGTISNASGVDLDGNPNTLYNNGVSVVNGTANTVSQTDHHVSWTAGANYYLTPDISAFGRLNSGFQFPSFDGLRNGQKQTTTVKQYEVGVKTSTKLYSLYLTGFYNDFSGLSFQQITTTGIITNVAGSKAKGIELEGSVRPLPGLELTATGDYLDAKYADFAVGPGDDRTGNRVIRQPKMQFRFTPSYKFNTELGTFKAFATFSYIGERFNDTQNLQILPKYHTLDAGFVAHLANGIDVRLTGTNLTNSIGITEGNTRVTTAGVSNGVFLGRPIFGRAAELSVGFNF